MVTFARTRLVRLRSGLSGPGASAADARLNWCRCDEGFTLLELLIVMIIIATLAAIAIPAYVRNVHAAREAALKEDLRVIRSAIDAYTVDKQKAPQSLDDLVTSGYVKAIPKDPITQQVDWVPVQSETLSSVDQTDSGGIDDVHAGAQQTGMDGTAYNTW